MRMQCVCMHMYMMKTTYLEGIPVEWHVHEVARLEEAHNELLLVGSKIRLTGRVAWPRQLKPSTFFQILETLLSNFKTELFG